MHLDPNSWLDFCLALVFAHVTSTGVNGVWGWVHPDNSSVMVIMATPSHYTLFYYNLHEITKLILTVSFQILDDKNVRRRFRASNYQSTTRVKPFICTMPMRLDDGWNQIQFNLADFTRRAYGTNYIETLRVQIHANCRIRRVYFSDRLYSEDELPSEFKLFLPIQNKAKTWRLITRQ